MTAFLQAANLPNGLDAQNGEVFTAFGQRVGRSDAAGGLNDPAAPAPGLRRTLPASPTQLLSGPVHLICPGLAPGGLRAWWQQSRRASATCSVQEPALEGARA